MGCNKKTLEKTTDHSNPRIIPSVSLGIILPSSIPYKVSYLTYWLNIMPDHPIESSIKAKYCQQSKNNNDWLRRLLLWNILQKNTWDVAPIKITKREIPVSLKTLLAGKVYKLRTESSTASRKKLKNPTPHRFLFFASKLFLFVVKDFFYFEK